MAKKIVETPLMKQYAEMKAKHPDAILLFRVGDFYETFSDDAVAASGILGITLTRRANGAAQYVELAGFPHHALETYLPRLIRAGKRVAICEQLEDPKLTKKLVKRGITELVTPGVNTADGALDARENNFLGGISVGRGVAGAAFLDISTGEFLCAEGTPAYIDKLISSVAPKEMLRMAGTRRDYEQSVSHRSAIYELDDWVYTLTAARERLLKHFGTRSLKGFGVDDMTQGLIAAGSLLHYLDMTQHRRVAHITSLSRIEEERYVRLDRFTVRNLELTAPMSPDGRCLTDIIDRTLTPGGSRLLRRWTLFPLRDPAEISRRQDVVEYFFRDPECRAAVADALQEVADPRRMMSKVSAGRIGPRELLQLGASLRACMRLRDVLRRAGCGPVRELGASMPDCSATAADIAASLSPDPPALLSKGGAIARGVSVELDSLRDISAGSRGALDEICRREAEATGIPSLKISFNNVFGYYIEVRNTHRDKVPAEWIRKQTLVSAERYVTPELKQLEERILTAGEKIASIEAELYAALLDRVTAAASEVAAAEQAASAADVLLAFAAVAEDYRYVRPVVDSSLTLSITEGRHPVIERQLPPGEPYISNSVTLDCDSQQIIMLTGPNMSGKSALLRQTALIALMAQMGSFVPAQAARIGVVDKIFTRVGASDNLSLGESTFMVEMNEAAAILNNMSERSLILFDELGRGTSTYDGISIAWAIAEHIHDNGRCRPRTLFATHYHELNEMERSHQRIANYNVSVCEMEGKVVFLRKLERGGSAHSFGIHVARLAGMPPSIVRRATQVLSTLEGASSRDTGGHDAAPEVQKADVAGIGTSREGYQLSIFQLDDPLLSQMRDRLLGLDIDNLTPLQALQALHDLQGLVRG